MVSPRWLSLFLAWTLLLQSLAPTLASPRPIHAPAPTQSAPPIHHASHENHEYLVDTSQAYAEVIQEAEWVNNALPLITRYDIGLDRLRMFKYQVTSNGPPPVYSPVVSGWYLFDGLGSTRAVVDDSGVGQSEFGYGDAFGIPYQVAANGTRATAGAGFFLNGQQWDGSGVWNSGEGLYFNRARYYQPGLGRFIGQDPFGGVNETPISLSRYIYANSDPSNHIDPDGMSALMVDFSMTSSFVTKGEGFVGIAAVAARTALEMKIQMIVSSTVLSYLAALGGATVGTAIGNQIAAEIAPNDDDGDDDGGRNYLKFIHGTESSKWGSATTIDMKQLGGGDFGLGFYTYNESADGLRARSAAAAWAYRKSKDSGAVNSQPKMVEGRVYSDDFRAMRVRRINDDNNGKAILKAMRAQPKSTMTSVLGAALGRPNFRLDLVHGPVAQRNSEGIYEFGTLYPDQWKFEPSGISHLKDITSRRITDFERANLRSAHPEFW